MQLKLHEGITNTTSVASQLVRMAVEEKLRKRGKRKGAILDRSYLPKKVEIKKHRIMSPYEKRDPESSLRRKER